MFDRRVAFSPNGKYLVTASYDWNWDTETRVKKTWNWWNNSKNRIRTWDLEQEKEVERLFPDKDNYIFMAASPDGRYFAVADGKDVLIFETPDYWRSDE